MCLSHSRRRTDRHTDLNFAMGVRWKDIKVKFEGQGNGLKVNVVRLKKSFLMFISMSFEMH